MTAPSSLAPDRFGALDSLYRRHHRWLQAWIRRRLGCAHQAADLAHDTFVRLMAASTAAVPDEPRAYLATIARGLVIDLLRRSALERAYLDALAAVPEALQPSPEDRAIVLEALAALDAMLDGLRPVVREAFLLSQIEGLTYPQIAERLGVSVRTVNHYMVRALEQCYLAMP